MTFPARIRSSKILFIIFWKVAGAFANPKYMTLAWKRPSFVTKAVFHSSPSLMRTLLYPHLRSILVNIDA